MPFPSGTPAKTLFKRDKSNSDDSHRLITRHTPAYVRFWSWSPVTARGGESQGLGMAENQKSDPTADPEFKRVLGNLLTTPHKPQSEMKVGKAKVEKPASNKAKKQKPPQREGD